MGEALDTGHLEILGDKHRRTGAFRCEIDVVVPSGAVSSVATGAVS